MVLKHVGVILVLYDSQFIVFYCVHLLVNMLNA